MAGVDYLHGTEFININLGGNPVKVVKSSVIATVGLSPLMAPNELFLVASPADVAKFGKELPGFTIPQTLRAIYEQRPAIVLVVNVFDPSLHTVAVALDPVAIEAGKGQTTQCPIGALTTIFEDDGTTDTGAVLGTDYTIDEFGKIVVLDNATLPDADYKISYVALDPSAVTNADVIGGIDAFGVRTGMKLWELAQNKYGFKPKQLIAPGFSTDNTIVSALEIYVNSFKAHAWIDAPMGTTVDEAITGRGNLGTINFNYANKRLGLLYNMPLAADAYSGFDQTRWFSAYYAGLVVANDQDNGYWFSPSNKQLFGIAGTERTLTWDINDATGLTEANRLNANGIITIVSGFGTGQLTWGNSSSAFPGSTNPEQFIAVQRTRDIVEESIGLAMLPFIDAPIQLPQIDSCVETVNTFIRELISRGALIDGSVCIFDPSINTPTELAQGHITFTLTFMVPTPMQRITFNSSLDISLLKNLIKPAS